MIALLLGGLILAVLVAIFAFQNATPVVVRFFRAELDVSLGLALTLSAAAGALTGLSAAAAALFRKRRTKTALHAQDKAERTPPER